MKTKDTTDCPAAEGSYRRSTFLWVIGISILFSGSAVAQHVMTDPRDGQLYTYTPIGELNWLTENLRFKTDSSVSVDPALDEPEISCGEFYSVEESFRVCPAGWRLPTEKEVRVLVKQHKRGRIDVFQVLKIPHCGRIDSGELSKRGLQNTFWIDAELKDGYIMHWHMFGNSFELHEHNVTVVQRKFPVRCVCEVETEAGGG